MKRSLLFLILCLFLMPVKAQQVIEVSPLFEYPIPPDEIVSLEERCNYILKNFWKDFDFKKDKAVDQYALNEAFYVYSTAFQFASIKEVDASLDQLLKKLSGNPGLLMQFVKAAEENLYGPRAKYWIDSVYLKFLDSLIKNKKISDSRKSKYIKQISAIRESAEGNTAPSFWFMDRERASKQYFPMSTPTIMIFGDPGDTDWVLARLKMDSNFKLSDALEKGKINILYIVPAEIENWKNDTSNYNRYWTIGQSNDVDKVYDIRVYPSIFIVGQDGKILKKHVSPEEAVNTTLDLINK